MHTKKQIVLTADQSQEGENGEKRQIVSQSSVPKLCSISAGDTGTHDPPSL
jgi:hypothetical protein